MLKQLDIGSVLLRESDSIVSKTISFIDFVSFSIGKINIEMNKDPAQQTVAELFALLVGVTVSPAAEPSTTAYTNIDVSMMILIIHKLRFQH